MEKLLEQILEQLKKTNSLGYSTKDLAYALDTNEHKIHDLRKGGALKGIKMGKGWFYPRKEVERFLTNYTGLDISNLQSIRLKKKAI